VSPPDRERLERRLLILAPTGKDAQLICALLKEQEVECVPCADIGQVLRECASGAAAILMTEEALSPEHGGRLAELLARQPPWSDLPVLLLTGTGSDSPIARQAVTTLGNVTLLERPVRVAALASAVRSALRARGRQYEARAYLLERDRADRRKDEFLATLAHELRNPLAPIRNAIALLHHSEAIQPHARVWEMMERQVAHMVRLVDDLMEVSRITRGQIALHRAAMDLGAAIGAAVESNRPLAEKAGHTLTLDLPARPLMVDGDAVRLAQVFANLLNNAIKYTDGGGRIRIAARAEEGSAVVSVTDSGMGIPADALPNVFEMFMQVNAGDGRSQGGLGIGLTLVRSIVELHGGTVVARSAGLGRGSELEVRLPLAPGQATALPVSRAVQPLQEMQRILVVDDNADAADSLGALLQMLGADVRVAHDGKAALETFADFRPAAVLLDLGMPGMDGYEVARRIRALKDADGTVLIALTGWGQDTDRHRSSAAGFQHHLVKPADIAALQTLLGGLR
jgi:signal transduction histidine kinase